MSQAEQRQQQLRLVSGQLLLLAKQNLKSYSLGAIDLWHLACSEDADPSCSASTLSNEEYASLLDAAMRFPDKQVKHVMCLDVTHSSTYAVLAPV